jgi:serine/threonine protein kinase/tetratricopeptide (TPR) repeat protein
MPNVLRTGTVVTHYRVSSRLGAGGMGEVYRAHDVVLKRDVALKFVAPHLRNDDVARDRLAREARNASTLNHPNICTIYEVGEASGELYIAMECVEGRRLSEEIGPGLDTDTVVRYGRQIADALAHAHEHGILHGDLKTSNVVITPEGRAKVLDFGLSKRIFLEGVVENESTCSGKLLTERDTIAGTLGYIAPETLRGLPPDRRIDIWSLGVVLFEMAAGRLPFCGNTDYELTSEILHNSPRPLPVGVPSGVRAVILKCLAKLPGQRYQHASEVRAALEVIESPPAAPAMSAAKRFRRHWRQLAWAAVLAGLLVSSGIVRRLKVHNKVHNNVSARPIQSIAVLPLVNISGDRDQEYFVDGMTDVLITDLAAIGGLKRVISRDSVMAYKTRQTRLRDIAQELQVDALVTGAVTRAGNQVRVTAQLIEPGSDRALWAKEYKAELQDTLGVQSEIARAIAQEVHVHLTPQEQQTLAPTRVNPKAYEAYLKGRFYWNKRNFKDLRTSYDYFQQAIALDETYALAYAGLADYYLTLANSGVLELAKARAAATRALELDGRLAEAHASLGAIYSLDHLRCADSQTEFKIAIALNPGYASAYQWYAVTLAACGALDQALAMAQRAEELDPLSPIINSYLGHVFYLRHDYDKAIVQLRTALELDRDFAVAHYFLARVFAEKGMSGAAVSEAQAAVNLSGRSPDMVATLAYAYASAGDRKAALRTLAVVKRLARVSSLPPDGAFAYASLHDNSAAFAWLNEAARQGSLWSISLKAEPALERLRSDSRFADLVRRVGLPE